MRPLHSKVYNLLLKVTVELYEAIRCTFAKLLKSLAIACRFRHRDTLLQYSVYALKELYCDAVSFEIDRYMEDLLLILSREMSR